MKSFPLQNVGNYRTIMHFEFLVQLVAIILHLLWERGASSSLSDVDCYIVIRKLLDYIFNLYAGGKAIDT
jgi:hypothetical protein